MSRQDNKLVVRAFWSAVAANDENALREVLAPDLLAHNPAGSDPQNRDELLRTIAAFSEAFSEQEYTIEDQAVEGDTVATRVTWRATHSGPFQGVPASGKRIAVGGIAISRIKNGQIAQRWLQMDQMGMLKQLGLVP